jgi:pilus assembly protein CpaB
MKQRLVSVLIFALVVSAAASVLIYRLINSQITANAKPGNRVLMASRNLERGDLIKDTDIKVADWGGTVPQGAIMKPEDAIGRGVIEPIYLGEPIVESRIAARGAGAGLAAIIPPGMRAVAVRVNDVAGVAGFVTPGMHVDILLAGTPPGNSGSKNVGTLTKTLLQNVEVLSAGQNIQKDNEGKPVSVPIVNLLVTPEQAEVMSLASNEERIQMILRNPTDKEASKTRGTAVEYLFNGVDGMPGPQVAPKEVAVKRAAPKPPPPPPPAKPEPPKVVPPVIVEVIHGSRRADTKFQPENDSKASEAKQ